MMSKATSGPFSLDVAFFDSWSDLHDLDEVTRIVAKDPRQAAQFHVACTNFTYAQVIAEHGPLIDHVRAAIADAGNPQELYDRVADAPRVKALIVPPCSGSRQGGSR